MHQTWRRGAAWTRGEPVEISVQFWLKCPDPGFSFFFLTAIHCKRFPDPPNSNDRHYFPELDKVNRFKCFQVICRVLCAPSKSLNPS